jgi:tetratricopeptide (TPR) repeat protein
MRDLFTKLVPIFLGLALYSAGPVPAADHGNIARMINSGYDLLETGKFDQAQKVYEELLRQYPEHPLALNNLGAIMCKKGKYEQALAYLNQALPQAKGFRVNLNRVCDVEGVCAAYRMSDNPREGEDLEWVIKSNIIMINMATSTRNEKR